MKNKPTYQELEQRIKELEQAEFEFGRVIKELQDSEERFRVLHDASFCCVIIHDKGIILDCSQEVSGMTGFTKEELIGMNGFKLIASSWHDQVLQNIKSGYDKRYEVEGVRKDGSVFPLAIRGKNVTYKGREVRVSEIRDITELKQAEQELYFTRSAVDCSADSAFWSRKDGRFVFVNKAACKSLGFSREELMTMTVSDFDPNFTPEAWNAHWEDLKERGSIKVETLHQTKDGRIILVEVMATFMEYNREEYNCSFVRDITGRKQAEEALQKAHNELECRVDERTAELEQKTIWLEESNIALKVLMQTRQTDQEDLERKMLFNVRRLILPYLDELTNSSLNSRQKAFLEIIETNLNEIIAPFAPGLTNELSLLTPAEIQVADLTKQGRTTKEIATLRTLSPATIATHKQRIRKKLGLTNKKVNLRTILTAQTK